MLVLVDTNVLLRRIQKASPAHGAARAALTALYRAGHTPCLTPQNVAEFWNVCTRPKEANGMGFTIANTDRYAGQLERFFSILPDSLDVFAIWRRLVVEHSVIGAKVHDARLAATMKAYNVPLIVTFNVSDFARFSGIEAVHPENFIASEKGRS